MARQNWRADDRIPLEEPLGSSPVGSRQGSLAGIAEAEGVVLDESPPRLAGYEAHLEPPPPVELEERPPEDAPFQRTGEQPFLPPGHEPGEREGPAVMGQRDFEWPPRLDPIER